MGLLPGKDHRGNWTRRRLFALLLFAALLVGGCQSQSQSIGPRPAIELSAVVEAYLQQYQPGTLPRLFQTTYLYARDGTTLAELYGEGRRTWVKIDKISPYLINATIATEDATFLTNTGIDPARIAGAALQNLEEGGVVSGASTITMQLARNLFLGFDERYDQNLDRKILEAGLAQELTSAYTKDEVLEMYLNLLNYGHLAYGPEAASQVYFGKSAADLTLAEATLLAGIPQQPANLDLFVNFERAKERQKIVLALMVRHGFLSEAEANAVYAENVILDTTPQRQIEAAPHFVNFVLDQLESRLGRAYVRRAGLHIYTTLDLSLQAAAEEVVQAKSAELQGRYDNDNAALVALRPGTNDVLVMVGSLNFFDDSIHGQVNVATSLRQPGSSIKPILYATALNDNLISPATVIWDTPITYTVGAGQIYTPLNYDRKMHGPVTVRSALANSFNIPAVKLLDGVGVVRMLESAQAMGLLSLSRGPEWYGLSLTLGGGEVTLLDLATAYHTLANEGRYLPPRYILAISDGAGQSLWEEGDLRGVQVISPAAASQMTDILSDNPARTPMFGANSHLVLDRPVAAKTGTTDDNRDAWTMGYTRYLLTGVWVGNTDGRPMRSATGVSAAGPIWNAFMRRVLEDPDLLARLDAPAELSAWEFPLSDEVELREECPPGLTCRQGGGELFAKEWLESAGEAGPLADSVVRVASAPVYADRGEGGRRLGYCGYDEGAVRSLLRLPLGFGLPALRLDTSAADTSGADTSAANNNTVATDAADASADVPVFITDPVTTQLSPARAREIAGALQWSVGTGLRIYLGPCDRLDGLAVGGGMQLSIDLAGAGQEEPPETAGSGAVGVGSPAVTGDFAYILNQPVWHDNNCPGGYVVGQVLNWSGAPVAGVRIGLADAWGNNYVAISKPGATDAGQFDFPLFSDTPQTLYLTVQDEAGNPISPAIPVPHNVDPASTFPCHHIIVKGG
ncbi:MAG: transglycosylase domain-containing protein [Caldilineaceae bacterium]|nr:transglycosylase domain-containing protein [Caldilineaceae bacterium]